MYKVVKHNEGECHYCDDVAVSKVTKDGEEVKCGGCNEPVVFCKEHTELWEGATALQQNEVLSGKLTHKKVGELHIHLVQVGGDKALKEEELPEPVKQAIEALKLLHDLRHKGYPDLADGLQKLMIEKAAGIGLVIQMNEQPVPGNKADPLGSFDIAGAVKQ